LENALSRYKSISADAPGQLIWSVAENYRFESGLLEVFVCLRSWPMNPTLQSHKFFGRARNWLLALGKWWVFKLSLKDQWTVQTPTFQAIGGAISLYVLCN